MSGLRGVQSVIKALGIPAIVTGALLAVIVGLLCLSLVGCATPGMSDNGTRTLIPGPRTADAP